ncbi:NADH:ubiquinone reductase (Na(+)-transporting) subunit C [Klebsiella indica]|uniref:Na(+)-translocating NADH-quinone reductase subunit C n=1 Tax=Klebsiella indica TaxID=2582917 RepID=A0A5R9LNM8_9ENTR|nr:NADH:ubiquinone reductase (Na(+)-transporting) subunit C [Klebsiella indica]TLV22984.1 NADH:ubiquinone reductase (Na(+)-transporting) subunit C [Klebsiella indica]
MRKGKLIVLILMIVCVLIFAIVVAWFLLSKDNFAVPDNAATDAAVLQVAGLTRNGQRDPQALKSLYQKRIVVRQVNLDSGELLAPGADSREQKRCVELAAARDPAQIRQRCSLGEVYLVRDNNNEIQQVILPIYGKGAKSMMYALIALATDGRTVKDLLYYQQNETPLLGARVEDPQWRSQWSGKKIRDNNGKPTLKVVQNNPGKHDDYTVDGISGATLTSTGVEKSINYWVGEQGYGKFLQQLQQHPDILTR